MDQSLFSEMVDIWGCDSFLFLIHHIYIVYAFVLNCSTSSGTSV